MCSLLDYNFYSKYVLQYILCNKFILSNIFSIPFISKISVTFILFDLVDFDDLCSSIIFIFFDFFSVKSLFY